MIIRRKRDSTMTDELPPSLAGLRDAAAYAHPVRGIRIVQTHVSWVLLTGDLAYKIKRPVCYPFLDMRDPQRRLDLCREELRLNQRFAAPLYLRLCRIVLRDGRARMEGAGELIDHAVCMRQFDRGEELGNLLAAGQAEPEALRAFGAAIADIHAGLPRAGGGDHHAHAVATGEAVAANLRQAIDLEARRFGTRSVAELQPLLETRVHELQGWMAARHAAGQVRECHGDLHCGNVVRWSGALMAFDCLEFDPALRWVDTAQEVAFLLADLQARGAMPHAHAFLSGYLGRSGDYAACRGLAVFQAHCALVRAKVAALAPERSDGYGPGFAEFVATALRALSARQPVLVAVTGLSGSGKTRLAARLAPLLGAIHLQSDVERRRLHGMQPAQRSASPVGLGLYADREIDRVYAHLRDRAAEVLAGGLNVILDATFGSPAQRELLHELAQQRCVPLHVVACRAPPAVLRQRVQARAARGDDASEADVAVLDWQLAHVQPITGSEHLDVVDVDTSSDPDAAAMAQLVSRLS